MNHPKVLDQKKGSGQVPIKVSREKKPLKKKTGDWDSNSMMNFSQDEVDSILGMGLKKFSGHKDKSYD